MNYFPAMLNIDYKKVVVVGGGKVATQKVKGLLPTKADIHIISPQITPELKAYTQNENVTWHEKLFEARDVDDAILIFATTNIESVNDEVEEATQHWQQLSRADAKGRVDFINPAVIRRGDLVISVSTSGTNPGYTRKLKADLAEQFDESYEQYIEFLKHCRTEILSAILDPDVKRNALHQTLRPELFDWLSQGDKKRCENFLQNILDGARTL